MGHEGMQPFQLARLHVAHRRGDAEPKLRTYKRGCDPIRVRKPLSSNLLDLHTASHVESRESCLGK